ncbi:unnamed protein product [Spirodela intermedia]|uniref:Major facilitator superfamily (MFS) profile domain-containing protein n=1 Tax=Spirodela intermedia TaxID=51605 RepID=A0A7I8J476_SPIIN|nr:unnamed protein product [Spirodela intermedia]CAA6665048.1 unnamed protein product [Spirodela intermedia]
MSASRVTLVMVNLAGIMERADEALLPAVYKEVGAALGATPAGLGSLTLFRSIVQSFCYPLAAYMGIHYNRTHVIALGAFLWAAATFLVAISSTFFQVAVARALNGVGLALVIPAMQSLVADSTDESNRGVAFGWLQLTGNMGSILGGFFALLLASRTFMGIAGWRVAFHLVGLVSVSVGILVRLFAVDPRDSSAKGEFEGSDILELVREAKRVIKIPSFQIIVAQGVTGSFPWSALTFTTMWLELIGFSHGETGLLMGLFIIMGDTLSKRLPNSGRIILSQISSGSAIPLAALLLLALPNDPSSGFVHGFVIPIFAEIVPERLRTSIYALDRAFEATLSSFHVFGYKLAPTGSTEAAKVETDRENATSLARALFTAIAIPMILCCLIYSFLYCTYPRDRARARMDSLIASEIRQIEMDNSTADNVSQPELGTKDRRRVIETPCREEDLEVDDSDEKLLLPQNLMSSHEKD